jgi:hypothetical protein
MSNNSFEASVEQNRMAESVPTIETRLEGECSSLGIRLRGCFVTDCELTSPTTGERESVLYADEDTSVAKFTGSHPMSPVGPYDGLGGQHGFPRWADYHVFSQVDTEDDHKRVSMQAKRPDNGTSLAKVFELSDNALLTSTVVANPSEKTIATSVGEHLYFSLEKEVMSGLTINGEAIDDIFGAGSQASLMEGQPLYWADFDAHASSGVLIDFPAGYTVRFSAEASESDARRHDAPLGMLVWHRPGSNSICFEPTLGFAGGKGDKLTLRPMTEAVLRTLIELQ